MRSATWFARKGLVPTACRSWCREDCSTCFFDHEVRSQMSRLAGFLNQRHGGPYLIWFEARDVDPV